MSETVKPMELIHTVANENGKNGSNGNGHFENINGAENDREDKEITLDQADAWGFGGRGSNQPAQVKMKRTEMLNPKIREMIFTIFHKSNFA